MPETEYQWSDRKRTLFGLPWSFTKYMVTSEKLLIRTGLFSIREGEVRLYRIMDLTLKRSFGQRIFGVGTIHCCSADKSTPEFDIQSVKRPGFVKDLLSDLVEQERDRKRVSGREYLTDDADDDLDMHE